MKTVSLFKHLLLFALLYVGTACSSNSETTTTQVQQSSLERVISDIQSGNYGEIHSLVVYQNDELVTENYFRGYTANDIHFQYSVTKSVTSTLIGIALEKGFISSLDTPLLDFFPEYPDIQNNTPWKQDITLQDVLSMRAGFEWDEWTYSYLDERNDANKLIRSDNMMKFMLDLPMSHAPGSHFTYNSGCTMLLSGIIENTTGQTVNAFAQEYLFGPLGITQWEWEQGNDDLYNTGWGLHLLPLDMAKIGTLFLHNGMYNNQTIVSSDWVNNATSDHGNAYGYQWWLDFSDTSYSARGWGGQFIYVIPQKNLILVSTAGNFNNGGTGFQMLERLKNLL